MERYLEFNKQTKEELVKETWGASCQEALRHHNIEELFDNMVMADEIAFRWGADLSAEKPERCFSVDYESADDCNRALFQPYCVNGKVNVYYINKKTKTVNPDFVNFSDVCDACYFFHSEHELDAPEVFEERLYNSYEEFRQEFKDKMAAYLPDGFDWDSHIGRFNYACLT